MGRLAILSVALFSLACTDVLIVGGDGDPPSAPRSLAGWYFAGVVEITWELGPGWDGDSFRIYARRTTDPDYFLIGEVTSCAESVCRYLDVNIQENTDYEYYVSAVHPGTGEETASAFAISVEVPSFAPPPSPSALFAVGLDGAVYLDWPADARAADDFERYAVYVEDAQGALFYLGASDSEGFVDLLAENGGLYRYRVTSLDVWGHESGVSPAVDVSPRPDYHGELLFAHADEPAGSGFHFTQSELDNPVRAGNDPLRHFRVEELGGGWWLVPGPESFGVTGGAYTTALRCGPAADAGCTDIAQAPLTGYGGAAVPLIPEYSYVLRVRGDDGLVHFGVVRIALVGFDGEARAVTVLDWAYQLRPEDRSLAPPAGGSGGG